LKPSTRNTLFASHSLAVLGVVYGDIGTSPLYAFRECFSLTHGLVISEMNVYGLLSLVFWSLTLVVSLKYVTFVMSANNRGEGGILALMALTLRHIKNKPRLSAVVVMLAIAGASLFYGDCVITPAMSVLSAVEGLHVISPKLSHWVVPLSILVLIGLFALQSHGTSKVGNYFGPVMVFWFVGIAILGLVSIAKYPQVLAAINPYYGYMLFIEHGWFAFVVLGAVVLVLTGAEALYADMGHFGRAPIQKMWFAMVKPALLLNYFGQGALLLRDATAVENPFYRLAPDWAAIPLLILATIATVIASQAVISGTYSMTQQAMLLGFCPRFNITHTSEQTIGQIYMPAINWGLAVAVILLVLGFESSGSLAAAYGIAVTGTMLITTCLAWLVLTEGKSPGVYAFGSVLAIMALAIDTAFFGANFIKFASGGWFPLTLGLSIFILFTAYRHGRKILMNRLKEEGISAKIFIGGLRPEHPPRVPGTAVFLTANRTGVPHSLLHNLKHNKVIHERVIFLTVVIKDIPYVRPEKRVEITDLTQNFYRMIVHYGFNEKPNIPEIVVNSGRYGLECNLMETSFFMSREHLVVEPGSGLRTWREKLFVAMSRNSQRASDFFKIPTNLGVELGTQIYLSPPNRTEKE